MTLDEVIAAASPDSILGVLACELREQRKEIAKLRVLLEHEETVRSKKLHRETPVKTQSFLRGSNLQKGDRVYSTQRQGYAGTIEAVDGSRVHVKFDDGLLLWRKMSDLRRVVASVA